MATFDKREGPKGIQWQVRIRRVGHPTLTKSFKTKYDAQQWARDIERDIDRSVFVDQREAEGTTFTEAMQRFIEEVLPERAHAQREIGRAKKILDYPFAKRFLTQIRGKEIADYMTARKREGRAPNTIRLDLALISRLFNVAARNWGMEGLQNPVSRVIKPKSPPGRERRLEPGEEQKLLDVSSPRFASIMRFALATAMRREEIASLTWRYVDLKRRMILLPKTKNGEARSIPLSSAAFRVLQELPRQINGNVFGMSSTKISKAMKTAADAAGLVDLRFHDLRHEAISRLVESNKFDILEIRMITGHKTLQMLARYTHLRAVNLVERMADL